MKRIALIAIAVLLVLVGLGFIMPAVAKLRFAGALPATDIGLLLLGVALTVSGPVVAFCCRSKRGA